MSSQSKNNNPNGTRTALFFKIVGWAILAVVLFVVGILMGVVNILTPDRLTPLTAKIATQSLQNAKVEIERVEVSIVSTFPFVQADIENLIVLSTVSENLDPDIREDLPAYTDTVLSVRSFKGGMNVMKLMAYKLDLSDVIIDHPSANLVIIDEETTNFDIIPPSEKKDEEPFNWKEVPGISLKRFAIVNPGKIRFFNYETQTDLSAAFTQVQLDGQDAPVYSLNFNGNIEAPSEFYEVFNIPDLKFGLNGTMDWSQEQPEKLRLKDFDFLFSIFGGTINTEVDFSKGVTFNELNVKMIPFDISQMLTMVPEDIAEEYSIPTPDQIDTDARLYLDFNLDQPWNIASDTIAPFTLEMVVPRCYFRGYDIIADNLALNAKVKVNKPWHMSTDLPDATVNVQIEPSPVQWDKLKLNEFAADITVFLPEGDLDLMSVNVGNLNMRGPATELSLEGLVSNIFADPTFDGKINGHTNLGKLPKKVRDSLNGSISGNIGLNVEMTGSQSMLSPEGFHKLKLKGDVNLRKLYWVSGDTVNMVDIDSAELKFGTSETVVHQNRTLADSLFRVSARIDSALILHSDLAMNLTKFNLRLSAQNTAERLTKGRVNPMGGSISLKTFNLLKTNDSTVVRVRDLSGYTVIKAYNNDIRTPEFIFDLNVKRVSTGNNETRLLVNNARTHIDAKKVAKSKSAQRFTKIADSLHYSHPDLPPDSVMKYALEIHNRHRSKYPRVHEKYEKTDSLDVIDWGASPLFKRMLTLWSFDGSLTSDRAGLFTPHLPLRNRLRNIDIQFNNDSINISNLQYKIGKSDFTINGIVSNMRKAFTSVDGKQPLRINFEMLSDTIDVNQITEVIMAGSAYSALDEERRHQSMAHIEEEEESLEEHIARLTENAPDTVMPILVPQNIDAEFNMRANNVLYSDFKLKAMRGRMLVYDGALNLQNLSARSDVGNIDLSALYSGLHPDDLRFGFGLRLKDFHLHRFLNLVPAIDSLLPVMRDFSGVISADIAATSDVDSKMNLVLPSLDAAIGIKGDSLVLLDPETFKSVSKWLLFKDKERNIIDHLDVQMVVKDNQVDIYPFIFDFDRYQIGVQGYNDFDMNFYYHIAILKSPIPFKFGINISGNPDKFKIRLGGAKFGDKQIRQVAIVDTTRVNLMNEINNVFKRGARNARLSRLKIDNAPLAAQIDLSADTLTHADSLRYIQEGLIDAPIVPDGREKRKRNKNNGRNSQNHVDNETGAVSMMPMLAVLTMRRRKDED